MSKSSKGYLKSKMYLTPPSRARSRSVDMTKHAWADTPTPSGSWLRASSEDRIRLVADALQENEWSSFLEVSRALKDGAVFLYPDEQLTASTRG